MNYTTTQKINNFFLTGHPNHNFTEKPVVISNLGDVATLEKPKDSNFISVHQRHNKSVIHIKDIIESKKGNEQNSK